MENASKALIMAAGILIAILILSLLSYLFVQMGQNAKDKYAEMEAVENSEFNQQFLNYEGRTDLTAQDVATLINLAYSSNKEQKYATTVAVHWGSPTGDDYASSQKYIEWLDEHKIDDVNVKYTCNEVHINEETSLVDYIVISKTY